MEDIGFLELFVIWVLVKFSFLIYHSSSFKDFVTTEWFGITFWLLKSSILFFITFNSSLLKHSNNFSSALSCSVRWFFKCLWLASSLYCGVGVTDVTAEWIIVLVLFEVENCDSWNKSKLGSPLERVFASLAVKIIKFSFIVPFVRKINMVSSTFDSSQLLAPRSLKAQRQIWDILQGVSSLGVKFTRKNLAWYD